MMTLAEVRDWLKTQVECPAWYIGKIDGSKEQDIQHPGVGAKDSNRWFVQYEHSHKGYFNPGPLGHKCEPGGAEGTGSI